MCCAFWAGCLNEGRWISEAELFDELRIAGIRPHKLETRIDGEVDHGRIALDNCSLERSERGIVVAETHMRQREVVRGYMSRRSVLRQPLHEIDGRTMVSRHSVGVSESGDEDRVFAGSRERALELGDRFA